MGKIVLMMSVSVDGFFAGPDGELDWHLVDDEVHHHFNALLAPMGAFLDGRVSHELMADYWPTADQDPAAPATAAEFARIWRDMPKYVFSRTLDHADWNTTVVREVVPDDIRMLADQSGGDVAVGGAGLAASFFEHDLIDEIRLYVHPVVLGRGRPLFRPADRRHHLRLARTRTFGNGVVLLHYARPAG
ncbi:dihydrofolate reductase family protein [Catellatospora sichuanensis]|uniref:dihydrofolate reductase family protein n=1 Tax=Catellatospora sichuanensis TaxID=1969805 RepID=UPI0011834959|nr:dihydrofolate reductase family protein [Catellatospora sichuanensis]